MALLATFLYVVNVRNLQLIFGVKNQGNFHAGAKIENIFIYKNFKIILNIDLLLFAKLNRK
jgi:hypothetical protein